MSDTSSPELQTFLDANQSIEVFEIIMPDINANLRGKWLPRNKIHKAFDGSLKLPLSALGFDVWGRDVESWVLDDGDSDGICQAETRSLMSVPWLTRPTGQLLISMNNVSGNPCEYDSRLILKKLQSRFEKLNLTPVVASEMEFHLFQKHCDEQGRPQHTQFDPTGGATLGGDTYSIDVMRESSEFMYSVIDACRTQDLPIDTLIKEAARSQYEINLFHQPDALLAADQGLLLQRAIKGVANQLGMRATFMAKPFGDIEGNGMHIHCSLINPDGTNAFNNDTDQGNQLLRHAIAGCLATMSDCMLIFAPHMNSYRRFQRASHAPTAANWGYENRTVSVRVPKDSHQAIRLEHRVSGADANPYLVISAIIAGMLYGIENKLEAPEPIEGDGYSQCEANLPRHWFEALQSFKQSTFIKDYFGAEFQKVFSEAKQQEMDEFDKHVTAMEHAAYL